MFEISNCRVAEGGEEERAAVEALTTTRTCQERRSEEEPGQSRRRGGGVEAERGEAGVVVVVVVVVVVAGTRAALVAVARRTRKREEARLPSRGITEAHWPFVVVAGEEEAPHVVAIEEVRCRTLTRMTRPSRPTRREKEDGVGVAQDLVVEVGVEVKVAEGAQNIMGEKRDALRLDRDREVVQDLRDPARVGNLRETRDQAIVPIRRRRGGEEDHQRKEVDRREVVQRVVRGVVRGVLRGVVRKGEHGTMTRTLRGRTQSLVVVVGRDLLLRQGVDQDVELTARRRQRCTTKSFRFFPLTL